MADVAVTEMAAIPESSLVGMPAEGSAIARAPFGRYLIRERIARGGMGEVFHAIAVGADGFEKPVVIKRLLPKFAGRTDLAGLFASEARLMTRLIHPNIVQVIDFGRGENEDYYLVMELVAGVDLGRLALSHAQRRERIPVPIVLYLVSQVLRGLSYAHSTFSGDGKKLIHRDISPGNVLLSAFGEVKVADFGVALVTGQTEGGTAPRMVAGKPGYIAPEQFRGSPVDERADLYSLGALFYEALTGSLPVMDAASDANRPHQLSEASLQTLSALVPRAVVDIVTRSLATKPDDRFADARAMAQAITKVAATGQPIADADDLAELVAQAAADVPSKRVPVVLLGANGPRSDGIIGTELTRMEGTDAGRFTVQLTAPGASDPSSSCGSNELDQPEASRSVDGAPPPHSDDRPIRQATDSSPLSVSRQAPPPDGPCANVLPKCSAPDDAQTGRPLAESGERHSPDTREASAPPTSCSADRPRVFSSPTSAPVDLTPNMGLYCRDRHWFRPSKQSTKVVESPDPYPPPATMEGRGTELGAAPPLPWRMRMLGMLVLAAAAGAVAMGLRALPARPSPWLSVVEVAGSAVPDTLTLPLDTRATTQADPDREAGSSQGAGADGTQARAVELPYIEVPLGQPPPTAGPSTVTTPPVAVVSRAKTPTSTRPAAAGRPKRQDTTTLTAGGSSEPVPATSTQETAATCRGQLHVYASHGWILQGGPDFVQAPGRYEWPCGIYSIAATSRLDGQAVRRVRVTVHNGITSVLDLR